MSSIKLFSSVTIPPASYQAVLNIDCDINAERIVILDRYNFRVVYTDVNIVRDIANIVQIRVPFDYSSTNDLLIGILDDDRIYDTVFMDGIKAEIIDVTKL